MYTPPFIPRADSKFKAMAEAFAGGIAAKPAEYGVTPADAAMIWQTVQRFADAWTVSGKPATHSTPYVEAKDAARNSAEQVIRTFANQMRANMGIGDDTLIGIGVRRRPTKLARRTCPLTQPLLGHTASTFGVDVLSFRDSMSPDSRAKPWGAERLELFVAHMRYAPGGMPPAEARYIGYFRKNPINVPRDPTQEFPPTYWARWAGFDGKFSPWSIPMSLASARTAAEKAKREAKGERRDDAEQPMKLAA